ncbi:ribonuclease P protein component [Candidatus Parcubacteria bacterium]|nr:ribonuclease P protein component [Candidatus Parcubacteria bacterium]
MLPKAKRLSRALFSKLEKSQKMANSGAFLLKTGKSEVVRVGVSVSKKVSKSAVVRNTVRRRVYSAIGPIFSKLKPGLYLLTARPGAEKLRGKSLEAILRDLLI